MPPNILELYLGLINLELFFASCVFCISCAVITSPQIKLEILIILNQRGIELNVCQFLVSAIWCLKSLTLVLLLTKAVLASFGLLLLRSSLVRIAKAFFKMTRSHHRI